MYFVRSWQWGLAHLNKKDSAVVIDVQISEERGLLALLLEIS